MNMFLNKQEMIVLLLVCMLSNCTLLNGYTVNDTNRLLKDKLADYNKATRPTVNQLTATVVSFTFDLGFIKEFDEVQQKLEIVATLGLQWKDEVMSWNPADYGGMYSIITESGPFWIPNLILTNNAEKLEKIGDSWQNIRIMADGSVFYYPLQLFNSICTADVTLYPWDVHYCYLSFLPQGFTPNELNITASKSKVTTTYYVENGAWEFIDSRVTSIYSEYYSIVNVDLLIERKPRYVIVNVILPIVFMAFLNLLVFLIPTDSGERISYSITVLLAIAVFLTIVGDNLPKTSTPMSYFSYFLMTMLVTSICIILCTIFNLRIYHSDCLESVTGCWAKIAGCTSCGRKHRRKGPFSKYNAEMTREVPQNGYISHAITHNKTQVQAHEPGNHIHTPGVFLTERNRKQTNVLDRQQFPTLKDNSCSEVEITWKDVSVALDKIFFVFFTIVIVTAVLVCVVIIVTSERPKSPP